MSDREVNSDANDSLVSAIAEDIRRHLDAVGENIYGYALLPWDMCTQLGPPTLASAYNREEDIAPKNRDDDYYRYCVNEWATWERDGFKTSNHVMASIYDDFKNHHRKDPEDYFFDEQELAFRDRLYASHLQALKRLREEGAFAAETYLVIWILDSGHEIMDQSARDLNSKEIYARFQTQFGDEG